MKAENMGTDIQTIRNNIDEIDNQIIDLLQNRMGLSVEMGRLKQTDGRSTYDPDREKNIIHRLSSRISPPLNESMITSLFSIIFSISRSLQERKKITYLGPVGSYSFEAAMRIFPCDADLIGKNSIDAVIEDVITERADYGIVPVENSTDGMIAQTLDFMASARLYVVREILLPIRHCLLSNTSIDQVNTVYSHPQPFAQCRQWLKNNLPHAKTVVAASTSEAAITAANNANTAAIASFNAASLYGLNVIVSNINDLQENITRFWVISRQMSPAHMNPKTSLIFSLENMPGALHHALGAFSSEGINLTKIESRPSRKDPWEYLFFVDFQGGLDDINVQKAMQSLKKYTREITILGTYPEGE